MKSKLIVKLNEDELKVLLREYFKEYLIISKDTLDSLSATYGTDSSITYNGYKVAIDNSLKYGEVVII